MDNVFYVPAWYDRLAPLDPFADLQIGLEFRLLGGGWGGGRGMNGRLSGGCGGRRGGLRTSVPELVAGQRLPVQWDGVFNPVAGPHRPINTRRPNRGVTRRVCLFNVIILPVAIIIVNSEAVPAIGVGGGAAADERAGVRIRIVRTIDRHSDALQWLGAGRFDAHVPFVDPPTEGPLGCE